MTTVTTVTTGSSSPPELMDVGEKDSVMEGCVDDLAATSWGYPVAEDTPMDVGHAVQT